MKSIINDADVKNLVLDNVSMAIENCAAQHIAISETYPSYIDNPSKIKITIEILWDDDPKKKMISTPIIQIPENLSC